MIKKLLLITATAFINTLYINYFNQSIADTGLYIYGTVTTDDDTEYTGQIRWDDEEAFWFDMFNSSKPENDNLDYLSNSELADLDKDSKWHKGNINVPFIKKWRTGHNDHTHAFSCRFGDIASLEMGRGQRIKVNLKSGESFKLKGGSNDIGADIQINDSDFGIIKLDWDNVNRVEFKNTPANLDSKFGTPLYGTVKTTETSFTGYVQWDHDERLSKDELNGHHEDGDIDIEFGSIQSIKSKSRGSEVTLKSGRSFRLTGTNDVNDDNRGIIVNIEGLGRVDIPWDEFEEVTFTDAPQNSNITYGSFVKGAEKIKGSVLSQDGKNHSGNLVFDLDEAYQCEILNGYSEYIEYFIPFENVKKISSKNRKGSTVELKSGQTIVLKNTVDVDEQNDGILILNNSDDPTYLPWDEVESIELN